jgi:hypothetical protein
LEDGDRLVVRDAAESTCRCVCVCCCCGLVFGAFELGGLCSPWHAVVLAASSVVLNTCTS